MSEHPCDNCKKELSCQIIGRCKSCDKWRSWFFEAWREIRKKFGAECVDSAQKGDDLNE